MATLKGKFDKGSGSQWYNAADVYGKKDGSWLYGKVAYVKDGGVWVRAWTDCRKFDAGGRDWSSSVTNCNTTTYTKTGCPSDPRTVNNCGTVSDSNACWSQDDNASDNQTYSNTVENAYISRSLGSGVYDDNSAPSSYGVIAYNTPINGWIFIFNNPAQDPNYYYVDAGGFGTFIGGSKLRLYTCIGSATTKSSIIAQVAFN